ncbi:MAG: tRNA (N(6)-L-threonylcarbamoyladenosine(37)-C(2))-methylthiotransferase MtaB [Flavobacteriales bacterium]|nr:tRNA (N(6)-L-threonylcarbamoyladenosine(37)-C(2))-methylthiotransferase MtaB [Flavobacteriales bacterium]MDG1395337.1 tRNA (N(6)-L-threonylcarbamoyladenosine(37)-C(2))-methylthiotransferase MtaB [Flavobacteriales bacterium]
MKKVAFHTLGCKLNFSETSTIARSCEEDGYEKVAFKEHADIYVLNTCSVTENADKECKRLVRQVLKINPDAFVVIIGCFAQLKPNEIAKFEGVDLVLGATEKFKLSSYLNELSKQEGTEVHSCEIVEADFFEGAYSIGDRTRAFLKVQDGCDYKCTYCTIPLARGISRSDKLENVLSNAKEISEKDIKEIVLTGVNIGDYGKGEFGNKIHEHTFLELVQELDKVAGISRLRISSIEPNLLKDETIDFVSNSSVFVPHFHIPLQSGSDELLKKMKRRYHTGLYKERVKRIKHKMPDACIGVDVIVGFPGETEEHFQETYTLLNELDISYLHVFTYSERANTQAAEMSHVIDKGVRHQRSKMLRILSAKKKRAFYEKNIGSNRTVLFEHENKMGYIQGFTENYVKVKVPYDPGFRNQILNVKLNDIDDDGSVLATILN